MRASTLGGRGLPIVSLGGAVTRDAPKILQDDEWTEERLIGREEPDETEVGSLFTLLISRSRKGYDLSRGALFERDEERSTPSPARRRANREPCQLTWL